MPLELSTVTNLDCDGEVSKNLDDTVTFQPGEAFSGPCEIQYEVRDEENGGPVTGILAIDGTFLPPLLPTPLDDRRRGALHAWNDHLALSGPGTLGGDHDRPEHEAYHWQKILVLLALHELGELDASAVEDARLLMRDLYEYWEQQVDPDRFELGNRNLAMRVYLLYRDTLFPEGDTSNTDLRDDFDNDMRAAAHFDPHQCTLGECSCTHTENHVLLYNSFKLLSKQAAGVEPTDPGYLELRDWWLAYLEHAITDGFQEWASTGEYEKWTWTAILNLADFSADEHVRRLATAAVDYSLALQAGQSAEGGIFASGGVRAYSYTVLGDYRLARTHMAQMLMTGGDLAEHDGGIHGPVAFAVSNYRPLLLVDQIFREGLLPGEAALSRQRGRYRGSCDPWFHHTYRGKTFSMGANVTPRAAYYHPHDTLIGYVSSTNSPTSHVVPIGYHPLECCGTDTREARHQTTRQSERGFGHKNVLIYTQGGISDRSGALYPGPQPPRLYVSSDFHTVEEDGKWIFLRNNKTYVAWQPSIGLPKIEHGMDPPRGGDGFFLRSTIDEDDLTDAGETCVLEVGDLEMFGSFSQFKQDVKSRNPDFDGRNYRTFDDDTIEYLPGSSTYSYSVNGETPFAPSENNWPRALMSHLQDNELSFGGKSLTFDPADADQDGFYLQGDVERVESRYDFGGGGWVPPDTDGLVVLGPPDVEVIEGEDAVLSILATGGQPPYQVSWEFRAPGAEDFEPVVAGGPFEILPSGSLEITAALLEHQGSYRARVEDAEETAQSRIGSLTVWELIRVTELLDSEKPLGGRALFIAHATGGKNHYGFTWQHSDEEDGLYLQVDQTDPSIDIQRAPHPDGGELSFLALDPVSEDHVGWYRVIAGDGVQRVTSNAASLTLEAEAPPLGLTSPEDTEAPVGSTASLQVTASGGTGEYDFTWSRSSSENGTYQEIVPGGPFILGGGGPFSKLTITPVGVEHAGWYQVVVHDGATSVESEPARLTVTSPPVVGVIAFDSFANAGAERQIGQRLDGVQVQQGHPPLRSWGATASLVFGHSSVTALASENPEDHVASIPLLPGDTSTAPVLTVSADVVPGFVHRTDWVAIGFWKTPTGGFFGNGEIWMRLAPSGEVAVNVRGTDDVLVVGSCAQLGCDFYPGGPNRLTLEYDTENQRISAWVNGASVLALAPLPHPEIPLELNHAAFDIRDQGLPDVARIERFEVSTSEETAVQPFSIYPPQSTEATEGDSPSFFAAAAGGTGNYTFQWQRSNEPNGSYLDLVGGEFVVTTVANESTLTIESVAETHEGWYRVKVWDGLQELISSGAELTVSSAPVVLVANDDPGAGDPRPFTFTTPTNTGEYWLKHNDVLKNDQPNSGTTVSWHSLPSNGSLDTGNCGVFQCFFYTPSEDFQGGVVTFSYRMTDGTSESNEATVTLVVPPRLRANPDPDPEDPQALTFWSYQRVYWIPHSTLLRNDVPAEDTEITSWTLPEGDLTSVFWEEDQSWYFRYDPPLGYQGGEITFDYSMRPIGTTTESLPAEVKVQIPADLEAVPDPDPTDPESLTFESYRNVYWIPHSTLLENDIPAGNVHISDWTDPEDGDLWPQPWNGSWYFYYDPPQGFEGGEIEFTYSIVRDGTEGPESEPALVKVQLPPDLVANDDPVVFETYAAAYSFPHSLLLANDLPSTGTEVSDFEQPEAGGLLVSENQEFTYTPPADFAGGPVEFTYRIRQADDPAGHESEDGTVTLTLPPPPVPAASFSAACQGLTCELDASASTGLGITYAWSFGDSTNGSGVTATHGYAFAGTYTVGLVVTDDFGQTAETSQQLQPVQAGPDPRSVVFPGPLVLSAADLLGNDAGVDLGIWAVTSWPTQGSLVLETEAVLGGPIVSFEYTPRVCAVTDSFSYRLLPGGGTQTQDEGVVTLNVLPDGRPAAAFDVSCAGQVCTFTDQSSDDSGYGVSWDFGDGHQSTESNPVHEYAPGTYTATLTVVDLCDQADVATREVDATGSGSGPSEFSFSCVGLECTFDGSALAHGATSPLLEWDFGDGTGGTGTTLTHRFPLTLEGLFEVTLTVTDTATLNREDFVVQVQVLNRRQALVHFFN